MKIKLKWYKGDDSPGFGKLAGKARKALRERLVNFLNAKLHDLAPKDVKIGLICFATLMTSLSLYFIWEGLKEKRSSAPIQILPIKPVQLKGAEGMNERSNNAPVSKTDYQNLKRYERCMDSIRQHNPPFHEQLLRQHPHLLDTVRLLKSLYEGSVQQDK